MLVPACMTEFRNILWEIFLSTGYIYIIAQESGEMFTTKSIPVAHKDLIHDVAYDFHGKRMATCSSDQCVKVE